MFLGISILSSLYSEAYFSVIYWKLLSLGCFGSFVLNLQSTYSQWTQSAKGKVINKTFGNVCPCLLVLNSPLIRELWPGVSNTVPTHLPPGCRSGRDKGHPKCSKYSPSSQCSRPVLEREEEAKLHQWRNWITPCASMTSRMYPWNHYNWLNIFLQFAWM